MGGDVEGGTRTQEGWGRDGRIEDGVGRRRLRGRDVGGVLGGRDVGGVLGGRDVGGDETSREGGMSVERRRIGEGGMWVGRRRLGREGCGWGGDV